MTHKIYLESFQKYVTPTAGIAVSGSILTWFLCRQWNKWYSRHVLNNAVADPAWDWSREIVILTGGSSGIGAAIAARLSQRKVKVVIFDVIEPKKLHPNQFFYKLDVSDSSAIASTAALIRKEHGEPTVLINNAGIGNAKPILEIAEDRLRKVFDINNVAHFLLSKEFLPAMIKANHGHIVTLASLASFATQASNVDYAATKAGALAFHEGLRQELKFIYNAPKVRTTIVHPGWIRTPMVQRLIDSGKMTNGCREPEEVADAIVSQLYSGYGAQITIPSSFWWTSLLRGLPSWLQEGVRDSISREFLRMNN